MQTAEFWRGLNETGFTEGKHRNEFRWAVRIDPVPGVNRRR
jgi:hypothetical protein